MDQYHKKKNGLKGTNRERRSAKTRQYFEFLKMLSAAETYG